MWPGGGGVEKPVNLFPGVGCVPDAVDFRRNFTGFNFAASAPKDVGIGHVDSFFGEMGVDGGLVAEDAVAFLTVDDAHDVDVGEARSSFAPVAMGHAGMAADFAAGEHFLTRGHGPMEEAVKAGDAFAGGGRFDVFEESGEAAEQFFSLEVFGYFLEFLAADAGLLGAFGPHIGSDFFGFEFFFECEDDLPFARGEIDGVGVDHMGWFRSAVAGLDDGAPHVADAEGEDSFGGQEQVVVCSGDFFKDFGVVFERFAERHFQGGPQFVI